MTALRGGPRARWTRGIALIGAGGVLLTGCSGLTPGTAAVVDGTRITSASVDRLAEAQCGAIEQAGQQGQSQPVALASIKQQSLQLLLDIEIDEAFAKDEGITAPKALVTYIDDQLQTQVQGLRGRPGEVLGETLQRYAASRAAVVQAGAEAAGQEASPENIEQLINAGLEQRDAWVKDADVDTDPRYSPDADGNPGGGSGSVSTAASEFAKQGSAEQADPAYVAALPASQKCG
ncbi:hypothetical protein [Nocardioides aurantiacus]|uniref:SurA-like protein n=1 Tax=Nocardioides aurantiacus TaxID=86796 RepID=A0A3N2CQC5_9ACTN|nr:hypothetical protein [Nocardioides aurantiacus]ROR89723.1 hypothetical protein EDD33_0552 [Nocardioides aurantiacus]